MISRILEVTTKREESQGSGPGTSLQKGKRRVRGRGDRKTQARTVQEGKNKV